MCSIQFISKQTGLSEEELLKGNRLHANLAVKSLCYNCMRNTKNMKFTEIAHKFGYNTHSAIIHQIEVLNHNPNHRSFIEAKNKHKCFSGRLDPQQRVFSENDDTFEIEVESEDFTSVKEDIEQSIIDKIMSTSALSPNFEQLIREINILNVRYSHQR